MGLNMQNYFQNVTTSRKHLLEIMFFRVGETQHVESLERVGVTKIEKYVVDGSKTIYVNDRFQKKRKTTWWHLNKICEILKPFG